MCRKRNMDTSRARSVHLKHAQDSIWSRRAFWGLAGGITKAVIFYVPGPVRKDAFSVKAFTIESENFWRRARKKLAGGLSCRRCQPSPWCWEGSPCVPPQHQPSKKPNTKVLSGHQKNCWHSAEAGRARGGTGVCRPQLLLTLRGRPTSAWKVTADRHQLLAFPQQQPQPRPERPSATAWTWTVVQQH